MPISTTAAYLAALADRSRVLVYRRNAAVTAGFPSSSWVTATGPSAVVPSTAETTNRSTIGAIQSAGDRLAQVVGVQISNTTAGVTSSGMIVIADRLSQQGGLVGNVATTQTTNLPTAALTRYTSGDGVWIGLEVYTVLGTTEVTATISYTNQAGTAGQSGICRIGGSTRGAASYFGIVALQAGDTGARSVESVTLSATTGAVGNFGVTLFRPLTPFPFVGGASNETLFPTAIDYMLGGGGGALPLIDPDACLWLIATLNGATATTRMFELSFIEDT